MEKALLDPVPVEPTLEQLILEFWLSKTRERLGADDPATRLVLGAESPEGLATAPRRRARKLDDPAVRKALWDGGAAAIAASDDPMIRFMVRIDPEARRIRSAYEERYIGPTTRAGEAIAKARFAVLGDSVYPDGTFTLRLAYGTVAGWTYRGKTTAPFTTFAGLYDARHRRAALTTSIRAGSRRAQGSIRPRSSTSPPPTTSSAATPARRCWTPTAT